MLKKERAKETQLKSNQYSYPILVDGIYEFHISTWQLSFVMLSLPPALKASRNAFHMHVLSLLLNLVLALK